MVMHNNKSKNQEKSQYLLIKYINPIYKLTPTKRILILHTYKLKDKEARKIIMENYIKTIREYKNKSNSNCLKSIKLIRIINILKTIIRT